MHNLTKILLKTKKNEKDLSDMFKLLEEISFFKDLNLAEDFSESFILEFLNTIKGCFY